MTIPAIRPAFGPLPLPFSGGMLKGGDVVSFPGFVVGCGLSVLDPVGGSMGVVIGTMLGGQLVEPNKTI